MIAQANGSSEAYLGLDVGRGPVASVRRQLAQFPPRNQQVNARYDAAQQSNGLLNYWANADTFDADAAHSRIVRHKLMSRSRYEVGNNGYSDGIARTYANDLIGIGPTLRMQTGSEGFNRLVETTWYEWTKAVQFRRKLWCQAHAKHQDGEGFAVARRNPRVKHPIKFDYVLFEAEQCQTPLLPYSGDGYIDGIKFDEFGNVEWYDVLKHHPGSGDWTSTLDLIPERIRPEFIFHWFKLRRPGQHRAVPECSSTLNVGAAARRWREAQLSTAEKVARFTLMLETNYPPEVAEAIDPLSVLDIEDGMMTVLPDNMKASQLDAKHPAAAHDSFNNSLIGEQARPLSMPRNKAMCDSSSYNYASGRLDHQTYYASLDVEREDCNDLVLDPLFDLWFSMSVLTFGWLGGNPDSIGPAAKYHLWDWPKHRVADIQTEASANKTKLETGEESLAGLYSSSGRDYEDDLQKQAASNGITIDQQRQINMLRNMPQHLIPLAAQIVGLTPVVSTAAPAATQGDANAV